MSGIEDSHHVYSKHGVSQAPPRTGVRAVVAKVAHKVDKMITFARNIAKRSVIQKSASSSKLTSSDACVQLKKGFSSMQAAISAPVQGDASKEHYDTLTPIKTEVAVSKSPESVINPSVTREPSQSKIEERVGKIWERLSESGAFETTLLGSGASKDVYKIEARSPELKGFITEAFGASGAVYMRSKCESQQFYQEEIKPVEEIRRKIGNDAFIALPHVVQNSKGEKGLMGKRCTLGDLEEKPGKPSPVQALQMGPFRGMKREDIAKKIMLDAAKGLDNLHAAGFVHRDIAARNILGNIEGDRATFYISDFGRTREADASGGVEITEAKNPLKWMAPEELESHVSTRESDVYAFGVTLIELSMGSVDFKNIFNETAMQHALGVRDGGSRDITLSVGGREDKYKIPEYIAARLEESSSFNELSDHTKGLIFACLSIDPERRPKMADIVAYLEGPTA